MINFKNYQDIKEFVDTHSADEIREVLKNETSLVVKALVDNMLGQDPSDYIEESIVDPLNHLIECEKFLTPENIKILLPRDTELLIAMFKTKFANEAYHKYMANQFELSANDLLDIVLMEKDETSLDVDLDSRSMTVQPKDAESYYLLVSFMKYFLNQAKIDLPEDNEEVELMQAVMDRIPLQIISVSGKMVYVVKDLAKREVKGNTESITSQLMMVFTRTISQPMTKYLGVGLVLGVMMAASPDAQAGGMGAIAEKINGLNASLSEVQTSAPKGCEFGAKVLHQNGVNIQYEVMLGDYVIHGSLTKLGSISKTFEQKVGVLKNAKGCGLSKEDVSKFAHKIGDKIGDL